MESSSRYLIGIDLGTTNSAVAYIDTTETTSSAAPQNHKFQIPQLIRDGEIGTAPTLPSFLYLAGENELQSNNFRLPWQQSAAVVGILAREQGALVPSRQVASAKSWLCHG